MKKEKMTEVRVGIFVVLGLSLLMLSIFMLGEDAGLFQKEYALNAQFISASGLRPGAAVQLAGVRIGTVDEIMLPKTLEDKKVNIKLRVEEKYQDYLRVDSKASIRTQGLLGDKYIFISVGSTDAAKLSADDYMNTETIGDMASVFEKSNVLINNLNELSASVRDLLRKDGDKEGDLRMIVSSLRKTLEEIEKGDGAIHSLIFDKEGGAVAGDLGKTLESLKHVASDLESGEGTLGRLISDPALYNDFRTLMGRANRNKLLRSVIRKTLKENERQVLK